MSLEIDAHETATGGTFTGVRGRRIQWRSWSRAGAQPTSGAVVIAHGYAEHAGRYQAVAGRLTEAGYDVYALDHHGHGHSEGRRAQIVLADAVDDLDHLISLAATRSHERPRFLLGHSLGGAIALRYAISHHERLTGLVLSGPLAVIDQPRALAELVKVLGRLVPWLPVTGLDASAISRDPVVVARYRDDPLVHHGPMPAVTAREMIRHVQTLPDDAQALSLPTLLLYGTEDRLCPAPGALMLAGRIGSADLTVEAYEGLYHEILNEPERETVIADIVRWLEAHASAVT